MNGQTVGLINATPHVYIISQQMNHTYNWTITNGTILSGQGTNSVSMKWLSKGIGKIKAEITSTLGCIDSNSLNVSINSVGVYEVKNTFNLQVFPNTNNGSFMIRTNKNTTDQTTISVVNMLGQEVWKQNQTISSGVQETQINTNLSEGIYLFRVQNDEGLVIKLIVVE